MALQGLQMLEKGSNRLTILATEAPDGAGQVTPIRYANDLAVTRDGTVYFTDSTVIPVAINAHGFYDTMASFILSFFQVRQIVMGLVFYHAAIPGHSACVIVPK